MVKLRDAAVAGDAESVAVTTTLYVPPAVGVPAIELPTTLNPGGTVDDAPAAKVQWYGGVPPEAFSAKPLPPAPNAAPTSPSGGAVALIDNGFAGEVVE
jgi:hypothetical protein